MIPEYHTMKTSYRYNPTVANLSADVYDWCNSYYSFVFFISFYF